MYKLSSHFENKLSPHTVNASMFELSIHFFTLVSSPSSAYSFPCSSLQMLPSS